MNPEQQHKIPSSPFVLACRCGQALRPKDMHRIVPVRKSIDASMVVHRIACARCAATAERW